ncbi:MAG: ABC transporter permease [Pseudomonadota bacterium]
MIHTCLIALLSHWLHKPLQLVAFIAGLAMATGLWSGVQAINTEARASYDAAANTLGEGQYDQLRPRTGTIVPLADYVALRRAGWQVSPVSEARVGDVRLVGIDPLTAPEGLGSTTSLDVQTAPETGPRIFANAETARQLSETLDVQIDNAIAPGLAIGDISEVQKFLGRDHLTRLIILPEQPLNQPDLSSIAPNLQRVASSQTADIAQLTDSFHLNLTAFGLLSFVVGLFIVNSTIGLAFEQRRGMIRTMRALGVPLRNLIILIAAEMLLLAMIGALLGIALGYVIAALLLPDVAATLRGLYGAQITGALQFRAEWWLSGLALALIGTGIAFASRAVQIARMPVLASARPRAWAMVNATRLRLQLFVALALLVIAGILALTVDGLLGGFVLLGFMLLGAALLFPVLADRVMTLIEARNRTPIWAWFWADTRQQLPGLSLALMALLLAVSANIGVATMVSSFRLTFVGFLDQRLAPELYVQAESPAQSLMLENFLQKRGLETLPLLAGEAQIAGQNVRLLGIRVAPTYRDNWRFLDAAPDVWDKIAAQQGVILNEQFARRADLWVGSVVEIAPGTALPVLGVVGDYGNPNAQANLSEDLIKRLFPGTYAQRYGIRTDDPAALQQDITETLRIPASAMIDQEQLKTASLDTFERTFLVTAALNVLTLGVAAFAILMSLLTLADIRLPQLAPVWALGFTRRQLGRLELLRAVALAGLVFCFAVPLGLALAWVLLAIVNVAAFGWRLPMFLFPYEYAALGLYALVAAAIAAAWPVSRLMRTPPSALLQVFSHER